MQKKSRCKPENLLRKMARGTGIFFSLTVTLLLLLLLLSGSGESGALGSAFGSYPIMDRFDLTIRNALSDALQGIHQVKKVYFISDDLSPAPAPNPNHAGTCSNASEMQKILEEANQKFPEKQLLFSKNSELLENSEIHYYLDDSIFSVSWKQPVKGCVYTFAEVILGHPSQFRRFLSGGEYGSGLLYTPSQMADSVHAVTASSGDYYAYRDRGVTIHQGRVMRARGNKLDVCFVDDRGDLLFKRAGDPEIAGKQTVEDFVEANHIRFSLSFGPVLLQNGDQVSQHDYPVGENFRNYSRAALCQQESLHYIVVTANMEPGYPSVPTISQFAENLQNLGIQNAYALDGGQTATVITNGQVVNAISYGSERQISDIIYFATAVPDGQQK